MEKYNCIIVDDDEVARLKVISVAQKFPILNIVGSYALPETALLVTQQQKIDVLFLDIDMPGLNGLEFRKKAPNVPVCVFITAHPQHAFESFELDTLDFLLKPLRLDRFAQTVNRITEFMEIRHKATLFEASFGEDVIFIKDGYDKIKIKLFDIMYVEALKDYTILVTQFKRHCVFFGIGNLLKEPNFNLFLRVHRSFAVQKQFIEKIGTHSITLTNNTVIPIGNRYKDNLAKWYEN